MANLLADLCVESEAHTLTALYLAATYDASQYGVKFEGGFEGSLAGKIGAESCSHSEAEVQELFRIGVAVGKYWVTKRYPSFAYECMEVHNCIAYISYLSC